MFTSFPTRTLLLLLALVVGAQWPVSATEVWEDEESWVRIEPAGRGAPPNEHPATVAAADLTQMLGALQVTRRRDTKPVPLFSAEELERITPYLSQALSRASAGEDVWFRTRGGHAESAFIGRKLFVTEGMLFLSEGRLNVIFNRLQEEARKRNVYGQRDEDFYSAPDPSRVRETRHRKVSLVEGYGVQLQTRDGAVREDWALIDPTVAGRLARQPAAPAQGETTAGTGPAPQRPPPQSGEDAAAQRAPAGPLPGADAVEDYVPLEERLRRLKELRDEGLITEEAYREKMRELLEEL